MIRNNHVYILFNFLLMKIKSFLLWVIRQEIYFWVRNFSKLTLCIYWSSMLKQMLNKTSSQVLGSLSQQSRQPSAASNLICRSNRAIHQRRRIHFSTCRSIKVHACEKIMALIETSKYRNSSVIPRSNSRKTRKWFQHDRIYIEIHIKMKNTFLAIYHYQTKWYHSLRKNWINF